jgi:hypothetical protein
MWTIAIVGGVLLILLIIVLALNGYLTSTLKTWTFWKWTLIVLGVIALGSGVYYVCTHVNWRLVTSPKKFWHYHSTTVIVAGIILAALIIWGIFKSSGFRSNLGSLVMLGLCCGCIVGVWFGIMWTYDHFRSTQPDQTNSASTGIRQLQTGDSVTDGSYVIVGEGWTTLYHSDWSRVRFDTEPGKSSDCWIPGHKIIRDQSGVRQDPKIPDDLRHLQTGAWQFRAVPGGGDTRITFTVSEASFSLWR